MDIGSNDFAYKEDKTLWLVIKQLLPLYDIPDKYTQLISRKASAFLNDEGYTKGVGDNKVITEKGQNAGMTYAEREDKNGNKYTVILLSKEVQKLIYEKIPIFKKAVDVEHGGEYHQRSEERVTGMFYGGEISFKRVFNDYFFTDEEVERLLKGEMVEFIDPREGKLTRGHLQHRIGPSNKPFFAFTPEWAPEFKKDNKW